MFTFSYLLLGNLDFESIRKVSNQEINYFDITSRASVSRFVI